MVVVAVVVVVAVISGPDITFAASPLDSMTQDIIRPLAFTPYYRNYRNSVFVATWPCG